MQQYADFPFTTSFLGFTRARIISAVSHRVLVALCLSRPVPIQTCPLHLSALPGAGQSWVGERLQ